MADNAAGAAAASLLPPNQATVTAEYRISFLAPAIGQTLDRARQRVEAGPQPHPYQERRDRYCGSSGTLVATALGSMVPFTLKSP
jgi:acyl-coenzyme A thioesterase PaaI-like protein